MWIYKHKNWPNFTWNAEALAIKLADIHRRQGHLLGWMENIGGKLKQEANLTTLTNDVVKSSAIEGEILNPKEVRSSIARGLGIDIAGSGRIPASSEVEGIVKVILDATQNFSKPLTKNRLFDWHAKLFSTGQSGIRKITVGSWRAVGEGPMQIVSGRGVREKVHFEAPNANRLEKEMHVFLDWFEDARNIDPVLKAGMAHLWFVTIHPFEDGNGRIGRAICDMALARTDNTQDRFYSLSSQIKTEQKDYYNQLEKQQQHMLDITDWLDWFLDCLGRAIFNAESMLSDISFKAQLWDKISQMTLNERQRLVINRMLEDGFQGHMNTSKYAKLAKCSNDSALRDITDLKERFVFIQNLAGGRSTSYRLPDQV